MNGAYIVPAYRSKSCGNGSPRGIHLASTGPLVARAQRGDPVADGRGRVFLLAGGGGERTHPPDEDVRILRLFRSVRVHDAGGRAGGTDGPPSGVEQRVQPRGSEPHDAFDGGRDRQGRRNGETI